MIMKYNDKQSWALEQFDKLAEREGSQNKAAQLVGVSLSIISGLKTGNYKGNRDKQFEKLIAYFELKQEASEKVVAIDSEYVPTSISEQVQGYIRNCQMRGGLLAISGDAGIGKTRAIRKFAKENSSSTIWITSNPCLNTVKPILRAICKQLNITAKTNDDMYSAIIDKLRDGMVIVIDEAQHLSIKVIETLRGFSDHFSDRGQTLGICFVGNSTTISKFGGKQDAVFEQIANRTLQKPIFSTQDIQEEDMRLLFPLVADQEMELEFLLGVARSKQAIRGAMNLFNNALDNDDYSYKGLVSMAKHMNLNL